MKKGFLVLFAAGNIVHAGIPVWTIAPLTSTSGSVPTNVPVGVEYRVTNQSKKTHRLVMDQIPGVTQDISGAYCKNPFTLASKESCVLKLNIMQAVFGGPIICEQIPNCPNCHLECYQPSPNALLNITQGGEVGIGQSYGGGKVACLNGGLSNLITANANNGQAAWGSNTIQTNARSQTNGAVNTIAIVDALGGGSTYAAKICSEYEIDAQGNSPCVGSNTCYHDWFLSAKDQLNCLYTNKTAIGDFTNAGYWSSTESAVDGAWFQNFASGTQSTALKSISNLEVRCVRAFTP